MERDALYEHVSIIQRRDKAIERVSSTPEKAHYQILKLTDQRGNILDNPYIALQEVVSEKGELCSILTERFKSLSDLEKGLREESKGNYEFRSDDFVCKNGWPPFPIRGYEKEGVKYLVKAVHLSPKEMDGLEILKNIGYN